jgi:segregation and condensation protein B
MLTRHDLRQLVRRSPQAFWFRMISERPRLAPGSRVRDPEMARLEAALFEAREPLAIRQLARIADLPGGAVVRQLLGRLQKLYDAEESGMQIQELGGGYQLLTRAELHPWLTPMRPTSRELRLSGAAQETLAIVAYRQPIMRADIEAIRAVQCGDVLRMLMERGLIRIVGRHESLGRPVLYGTTKRFLQEMGLKSLDELPRKEEFG